MDIQIVKEDNGHLLIFCDGDISSTIFIDKKNRYKLMQILIDERMKEI